VSGLLTERSRPIGKRGLGLLAALAATVALSIAAGPVSSASADPGPPWRFCDGVWLAPYGQPGDRCFMPTSMAGDHMTLSVITWQRAGCVALLGYYGEQLDSWTCGPATGGTFAATYYVAMSRPFGYYRAAIRNNNLSNTGQFNGAYLCCQPN
jgi:hypothetical protein